MGPGSGRLEDNRAGHLPWRVGERKEPDRTRHRPGKKLAVKGSPAARSVDLQADKVSVGKAPEMPAAVLPVVPVGVDSGWNR